MMLTTQEVADRLKVHVRTVQRLIEYGELKAIRVGTLWRIRGSDYEEYVDGGSSIADLEQKAEELERYQALAAVLVRTGQKGISFHYENDKVRWRGESDAFSPTLRGAVEKSMAELKEVMERLLEDDG